MTSVETVPTADLLRAVEAFLYREARLMDERAYEEWLALWGDDASYVVPGEVEEPVAGRDVHIIYAGRLQLEDRIARLTHSATYAQEPPSQLCRLVSNVEIERLDDADDTLIARSKFILAEVRRGRERILAGSVTHHLRQIGDDFRMLRKHVLLVNRAEPMTNLAFLV